MTRVTEVVERSEWFDPEDFDRAAAVETVESNLRDRHDVEHVSETRAEQMMSGDWKVTVSGPVVDQRGDPQ